MSWRLSLDYRDQKSGFLFWTWRSWNDTRQHTTMLALHYSEHSVRSRDMLSTFVSQLSDSPSLFIWLSLELNIEPLSEGLPAPYPLLNPRFRMPYTWYALPPYVMPSDDLIFLLTSVLRHWRAFTQPTVDGQCAANLDGFIGLKIQMTQMTPHRRQQWWGSLSFRIFFSFLLCLFIDL